MRILIVEDEQNLAQAIVELMSEQKFESDIVFDGADALEYARSGQYDAMILDVMIPKLSGFQVAKLLRNEANAIPILMLTARDDIEDKVKGLDSGADDYLTKPFTAQELQARVRALTRRKGQVQMDEIKFADTILVQSSALLKKDDKQVKLSQKEFEVMKLLISYPNQIISKNDLIVKVWGIDADVVDNNVAAYISFLRKKLFILQSKLQITSQRKLGYILEEVER